MIKTGHTLSINFFQDKFDEHTEIQHPETPKSIPKASTDYKSTQFRYYSHLTLLKV